jgi:ElaB/YqjD/DUF883 family membrane-anchored ribosome-binding protein
MNMADTATYEKNLDQLRADFEALRSDVSSLVQTLKSDAIDQAHVGYDKLKQAGGQAADQVRVGAAAVERQIEDRPLTSVLAAFGIGFIIGKLMEK